MLLQYESQVFVVVIDLFPTEKHAYGPLPDSLDLGSQEHVTQAIEPVSQKKQVAEQNKHEDRKLCIIIDLNFGFNEEEA